jgi:hypothetical protein
VLGNYARLNGVRLSSGVIAYKGLNHRHWSQRFYSKAWRTWTWYDASTAGWYYWNSSRGYFLPVSQIIKYPPIENEVPPGADSIVEVSPDEAPDLPEVN